MNGIYRLESDLLKVFFLIYSKKLLQLFFKIQISRIFIKKEELIWPCTTLQNFQKVMVVVEPLNSSKQSFKRAFPLPQKKNTKALTSVPTLKGWADETTTK